MFFAPLNGILSSGVRVRALRVLADAHQALSGREIARQAHASRAMTQRGLGELAQLGVVLMEETPAQHLYRLNENHHLVRDGLLPLFRAERKRADELFQELRRILLDEAGVADGRVLAAYLFGSAARGDDVPGSDLDVLVITPDARAAEAVHDTLSARAPALRTYFGVVLSPVVLDLATAREQAGSTDSFLRDAIRDGRRIYGKALEELLW
ncbi:nucleotidyltransferase domain-containing protein [Longimicrobium sp.]|jgi:predicted nucleotidyltransferase|uniref:nucleotidyltransferase domain-containing protein n=1 Tax=Longimicrobium sp. TaxID=2029185 RepID=UPI002F950354